MDTGTDASSEQRLYLASAITRVDGLLRSEMNRARHIQLTAIRQDILAAAQNAHMGSSPDVLAS